MNATEMKLSHDLAHAGIALDESGIATVTIRTAGDLNLLKESPRNSAGTPNEGDI